MVVPLNSLRPSNNITPYFFRSSSPRCPPTPNFIRFPLRWQDFVVCYDGEDAGTIAKQVARKKKAARIVEERRAEEEEKIIYTTYKRSLYGRMRGRAGRSDKRGISSHHHEEEEEEKEEEEGIMEFEADYDMN